MPLSCNLHRQPVYIPTPKYTGYKPFLQLSTHAACDCISGWVGFQLGDTPTGQLSALRLIRLLREGILRYQIEGLHGCAPSLFSDLPEGCRRLKRCHDSSML